MNNARIHYFNLKVSIQIDSKNKKYISKSNYFSFSSPSEKSLRRLSSQCCLRVLRFNPRARNQLYKHHNIESHMMVAKTIHLVETRIGYAEIGDYLTTFR